MRILSIASLLLISFSSPSGFKNKVSPVKTFVEHTAIADSLPGKGILEHSFLYAGEWQGASFKDQKMYIIRDGKITWSYTMPQEGEYGDATMLSNGNIVFSRKTGASEITPDKRIIWNYDAPPNSEIHTCQPIGLDRVMLIINMVPAKAVIINTVTNQVEKELPLPTAGKGTHGMFRHCRYTADGTFLIAQMDMGKVIEYTADGKPIWSVDAPDAWAAVRLKNGNTLISGNGKGYTREVDKDGKIVWEFTREDAKAQGVTIYTVQQTSRLANGNTLIGNWNGGHLPKDVERKSAQLIEVNKDKKIVWVLSSWDDPNLGPASTFQLLNKKGLPSKEDTQR